MEDDAGKVMSPGPCAEDAVIQHVGKPRQGMPIPSATEATEGPFDACPGQASLHVGVGGDVKRVIVVYEIVPDGGKKYRKYEASEQKVKQKFAVPALREITQQEFPNGVIRCAGAVVTDL